MVVGVPLRDVLALPPLHGAHVVAGERGLGRPVRHVNVMEVPDILGWVQPEELLLTTAYPLREDPMALVRLVPALAERGLAGLAIKPARYIPVIPPEALAAADALGFPVIELPPPASFNEIINAVLTVILNVQALRLQRTAEVHQRFTAIALGGGGLGEIAEALAELIGRPVGIADAAGTLQAGGLGSGSGGRRGRAGPVLEDAGGRAAAVLDGEPVLVQPIRAGSEHFGSIVVAAGDAPLEAEGADALEYAATVAALRLVQARVVAEADRRFQAICLEELISAPVDRAVLLERATAFKWDLSIPRAVLLARIEELGGRPFAHLAGRAEESQARHRLADAVRTGSGRTAITWERSAEVAALVAAPRSATAAAEGRRGGLEEIGRRVAAEARRSLPDAVVSIGIGRPVDDPAGLAGSFADAARALEVGRWSGGPGRVTTFDALGLDRLLAGMAPDELHEFVESTLAPLLAYDRRHRLDLCGTLETYLASRNGALAARQLFVHYNTLKNRLALIEAVLGPVLDDPERSLALAVALHLRRLPSGGGAVPQ